jgi:TonB family protein
MSTALPGADSVGRLIDGRFTLLRFLGGTESSSVFLTELGDEPKRKAAIKFISADQADGEASIAQWEAARPLSHPHLISLLEHGRSELDGNDLLYAVTEYADEVLSEILPERPLTPAETREMLGPVLDALAFLHGRDLVHGHLKPSNIMVVDDRLKLSADRIQVAGEPHRRPTSSWDAPEAGTEKITPAADLWSLGVVLVQVLTQQLPHWDRAQGAEPEVPASIPEPFSGLARECLRVDPARRLTLSGVQAHLEPAPAAEPVGKSTGRPLSRASAMAIIGALLGVGVVLTVLRMTSCHTAPSPAASSQPSSQAPPAAQPQSPAPESETIKASVVKGEVASRVLPDVPAKIAAAIRGHIKVAVRLQVDTQGNVVQASFDSPGPSRYFADQALHAAEKWRFTPAWVGGRTAASVWLLEFQFASAQTDATAQEKSP